MLFPISTEGTQIDFVNTVLGDVNMDSTTLHNLWKGVEVFVVQEQV